MPSVASIDMREAVDRYRRNRARSEAIFDLIDPAAYYSRPIALRNPIVFYEGHLPAFSVIAFLRRGLGLPAVDAPLEKLFERGIDPDSAGAAIPRSGASTVWPSRDEVRAFARACDEAVLAGMAGMSATPEAIQGLYTALEHEAMHQETLLYMWHRLGYELKHPPSQRPLASAPATLRPESARPLPRGAASVGAGLAVLGADTTQVPFGWDNEFGRHVVHVAAFDVDVFPIT